jgi:hypothetical protein
MIPSLHPVIEDARLSQAAEQHYTDAVSSDDAIGELLDAVRGFVDDDLPHYTRCLTGAFDLVQPVFMRKRYASFFWHCAVSVPSYLEHVVAAGSSGEGEGAEKLFGLWSGIDDDEAAAAQVLRHAQDEARHARMFLRLADAVAPGCLAPDEIARREALLPASGPRQRPAAAERIPAPHLIDHLVQMNIGEIRTRLHMHLFAPVLYNVAPAANRKLVRGTLEALAHDELRHIAYTAQLVEQWAREGDAGFIASLYCSRLDSFNRITVEHTEGAVRQYGQGRFPDLLAL